VAIPATDTAAVHATAVAGEKCTYFLSGASAKHCLKSARRCLNLDCRLNHSSINTNQTTGVTMKNPLYSIVWTIISGFVLTAILYVFVVNFLLKV
jgi:hypothetical protein